MEEKPNNAFNKIVLLLPSLNYSTYTLDDLENPKLVAVYGIYWDVSLFITTSLFCFMLHMIIKKSSSEMSGYKWYLVHQLTWSYIFDVYFGFWKVVPLWPFFMGYSTGIFANLKGNYARLQLLITIFLAVGMAFSVLVSVVHRYVQASPFSYFYRYYNVIPIRAIFYVVIFIGFEGTLVVPILFILPEQPDLESIMTSKYPALIEIYEAHSSVFGYETTDTVLQYMVLIMFVIFIVCIFILILYLNFLRILKKNKQHLSIGTYNMQLMLFKTLFIQIVLFGILLIFPASAAFILTLFGFRYMSKISLVALAILGTHAFFDFFVLSYFIRSYREHVKSCYNAVKMKLGFKVELPIVTPLGPSTVSDMPTRFQ
uniref:Serpentine Receptor, class H n=1 Tax=Panagrellus redivivus TaxID=6233 RepID=A0A7E4W967_PANRE